MWKSIAIWNTSKVCISLDKCFVMNGTLYTDGTTDTHDSEKSARFVCNLLKREGFGGERKIFPLATFIESPEGERTEV